MVKTDPLNSLPDSLDEEIDDLYDLLGVSKDAPTKQIDFAYKQKIKEYHPDHNDSDGSEQLTFALNKSIDILGEQNERMLYDQLGHDGYFNEVAGADTLRPQQDVTTKEPTIYDIIRMTNFEAHKNQGSYFRTIIGSKGFKIFMAMTAVMLGTVGGLAIV